jgi:hypothetical protein
MQHFRWLWLLALAPWLIAADCSPTKRARSYGCPGGAVSCQVGSTVPACINFCAPVPTPAQLAAGAKCVLDPCDQAGLAMANTFMCPNNWSCVPSPSDPRYGTCAMTGATPLRGCDAMPAGPPCSTGTYCRTFGGGFNKPVWVTGAFTGLCVPFIREGSICNANAFTPGTAATLQCESGTSCLNDPDNVSVKRCQRPCTSDAQCPCEPAAGGVRTTRCLSEGGAPGVCNICIENRGACDLTTGAPSCCDTLSSCNLVAANGLPAGTRQCCRPPGTGTASACTSDAQCCSNALCVGSKCTACGGLGLPAGAAGCCTGLAVRGGVCSRPCLQATGTQCRGGPGCNVNWTCTTQGDECPIARTTIDSTCNGMDDDCNGYADEDFVHSACSYHPPDCPPGFTVDSTLGCSSGTSSCQRPRPVNWCRTTGGGSLIEGGGGCYQGTGYCAMNNECSPGERCGPIAGACSAGIAGCCEVVAVGGTTWAKCCVPDPTQGARCWRPGEHRT